MKTSFFLTALFIVAIGFVSCENDEPEKSKACDIVSFKTDGTEWQINATNITRQYSKGTIVGSLSPEIEVSDNAKVIPASGSSQDFSSEREVEYTVTAEDGVTVKVYKVKATVATTN